jgi:hypothetical protein
MNALNTHTLTKLWAVAALFSVASAFAGTKDGGGGGAYVCLSPDGSIRYSLMADLWEAANTPFKWPHKTGKLKIVLSNEPAEAQFKKAMERIASLDLDLAEKIIAERDQLFANRNPLSPEDIALTVPDDLKLKYYPPGCEPKGMMFYNAESEQLDIREDIFATLKTQTDVAAAWAHEAIYKVFRDTTGNGFHSDSKLVRRLVGCIFSEEPECLGKRKEIPNDGRAVFECKGKNYQFLIYPTELFSEPREWLKEYNNPARSMSLSFRLAGEKIGNLRLRYSPLWSFGVSSVGDTWSGYGESPFNLYERSPTLDFRAPKMNKENGYFESLEVLGYDNQLGKRMTYVEETLPCRRVR